MAWCLDTVVTLPLPFVRIVAILIWSVDRCIYIILSNIILVIVLLNYIVDAKNVHIGLWICSFCVSLCLQIVYIVILMVSMLYLYFARKCLT